jgi:uncharacterized protein YkwD
MNRFWAADITARHALRSFSIFFRLMTLIMGGISAMGVVAHAQDSSSRPVARLISSSREVMRSSRQRRATAYPAAGTAVVGEAARTPSASSASSLERRAFDLINAERRASGFAPLVWDEELCRMARQHSGEMVRQNFFSHEGPDGDMVDRAHALGIRGWRALGENIAYNQGFDDPAAFAVERWMGSAKHRANILNGMFTRSGLGIARAADGRIFFTQVFAAR